MAFLWHVDTTLNPDRIYKLNPTDGSTVLFFSAPANASRGLAFHDGFLWLSDQTTDLIYKLDPADGSVVSSFATPTGNTVAIGFDANGDLWTGDDLTDTLYRCDPTDGTVIDSKLIGTVAEHGGSGPHLPPSTGVTSFSGLDFDSDGFLWLITNGTSVSGDLANALKVDQSSWTVVDWFEIPASQFNFLRGLAIDDNDNLWTCDIGQDDILQASYVDGTVLIDRNSPSSNPIALAWESTPGGWTDGRVAWGSRGGGWH